MGITLSKQELESKLWQAADILRGQINAADYKNYIFSIMFLKRLSDRFNPALKLDATAEGKPTSTGRPPGSCVCPTGGPTICSTTPRKRPPSRN